MADDRTELPTRNNMPTLHEESNVAPPKDNGIIDLTNPKPVVPDVTSPPEPKPKEDVPPKTEPDAEPPKEEEDLESLRKKRKELEEDNFKYRERLRQKREDNEELRARIDRLESSVSHVTGDKDLEEASKKVQAELGIDKESADKLTRAFREINKPKTESQPVNLIQRAAKEFSNQSLEAMEDFSDWDTHRTKMTELLEADIKANGELKALKRGPLYYYSESRRLSSGDAESAKAQGRKEMADRVNSKNLSVSESSRNSQGRPNIQARWTRESVADLARNNPDEYQKRRSEIMTAMNNGEIQ